MERHQGKKDQILAAVLKKNPSFINEPVYAKRLEDEADKIVEQYAVGRLIVAGDNRYLSGDLLDFFLDCLPVAKTETSKKRPPLSNFSLGAGVEPSEFLCSGAAYQPRSCLHAATQSAHCPQCKRCSFILSKTGQIYTINISAI